MQATTQIHSGNVDSWWLACCFCIPSDHKTKNIALLVYLDVTSLSVNCITCCPSQRVL